MLKGAERPREGVVATVIGIGTLIFAAIGVVVQLKDALNTVWEVKTTPGSGVWRFVRSYILSLAGVLALGFLLLTSILLTAALAAARICRSLSARGDAAGRGLRRVVRGDLPVLRHDTNGFLTPRWSGASSGSAPSSPQHCSRWENF